jgi:S1-C subfamily serine protease
VVAIGGSLSDRRSVTRGIVSSLHRTVSFNAPAGSGQSQLGNVIQTDAGIDTSMSGGPLLNTGGQVVGVTMAAAEQIQPVDFALAASDLQPQVEQIMQTGRLVVPSLGAEVVEVGSDEAVIKGTPAGARVTAITSGGPAERAGLRTGDVIVQLDDQRLDDAHPLAQVLRSRFKPDQKVTISYTRAASTSQVQLTLRGEHPPCP